MEFLTINSVSKKYKGAKNKANDRITTSFKPGQITALVGHNGAGKTTLLNQIVGITKPDSGDIIYRKYSFVRHPELARNFVSMMPQFHAPLMGVTVSQAIKSIMYIKGVSKSRMNYLLSELLKELEIEEWKDTSGDKLSGGLRRLTSFAMTVVEPSDIIILDEPTNDVDPVRRKLMWKHLRKLSERGCIVIIVTHNLLEAEQYADRYLVFENGEIIKDNLTQLRGGGSTAHTLLVDITDNDIVNDKNFPETMRKEIVENGELELIVSVDQMEAVMSWLVDLIKQNKVLNYKLSPATLECLYGRMINGE